MRCQIQPRPTRKNLLGKISAVVLCIVVVVILRRSSSAGDGILLLLLQDQQQQQQQQQQGREVSTAVVKTRKGGVEYGLDGGDGSRMDVVRDDLPPGSVHAIVRGLIDSRAEGGTTVPTYACPCCGWQGARFASAGGTPNRRCPNCKSYERHRRACALLGAGVPRDGKGNDGWLTSPYQASGIPFRLAHFGPQGQMERVLNAVPNVDQVGLDYFVRGYRYSEHTMHADVTDIRLPTDFADGVLIFHVLEHVPDIERAFAELKRITKGWMMLEVPCYENPDGRHRDCRGDMTDRQRTICAGQWDHVWFYDCRAFPDSLREGGLDCYEVDDGDFGDYEPLLPSCNCHKRPPFQAPLFVCTADE